MAKSIVIVYSLICMFITYIFPFSCLDMVENSTAFSMTVGIYGRMLCIVQHLECIFLLLKLWFTQLLCSFGCDRSKWPLTDGWRKSQRLYFSQLCGCAALMLLKAWLVKMVRNYHLLWTVLFLFYYVLRLAKNFCRTSFVKCFISRPHDDNW